MRKCRSMLRVVRPSSRQGSRGPFRHDMGVSVPRRYCTRNALKRPGHRIRLPMAPTNAPSVLVITSRKDEVRNSIKNCNASNDAETSAAPTTTAATPAAVDRPRPARTKPSTPNGTNRMTLRARSHAEVTWYSVLPPVRRKNSRAPAGTRAGAARPGTASPLPATPGGRFSPCDPAPKSYETARPAGVAVLRSTYPAACRAATVAPGNARP